MYVPFEKCPVCGMNRRLVKKDSEYLLHFECVRCHFKGGMGRNATEAKQLWNKKVATYKEEKK